MLLRTLRRLRAGRFAALRPAGALAVLATATVANAQYYGGYDPCNPCQTVCQTVCQQTAMVVQPCYQTVPVTETRYEEREFTEYRPVTETKTAEIPVTTYTPVTEVQTVVQDRSFYATRYAPNYRISPCAYDPRPGLFGWMNRTGYEIRSAFTPRYSAYREYVPNQVAMQVPITRQIAQQGSRQVTYNVTRYEPHTATRQVAVNETKWVAEEQTVSRPVTTYRSVPVGTTIAYAPLGGAVAYGGGAFTNVAYGPIRYNGTATALGPTPDPISARGLQKVPSRTATNSPASGKPATGQKYERAAPADPAFGTDPSTSVPKVPKFRKFTDADRERILNARRLARNDEAKPAGPLQGVAVSREAFKPFVEATAAIDDLAHESALASAFERPTTGLPFAVRSVRWTAPEPTGPELIAPTLAAVE